jgi:hypothetical protein
MMFRRVWACAAVGGGGGIPRSCPRRVATPGMVIGVAHRNSAAELERSI